MLRILRHGFAVLLLTLLTQIGGLAWLLALALRRFLPWSGRLVFLALFVCVYAAATLVTHQVAPLFGRMPLPCFTSASLTVRTSFYCALNRNYVTPELKEAAEAFADHMASSFPGTTTLALDANFPFVSGFPLLPHLSHDDGRKLDLALYYRDDGGNFRNGETRSPLGYFAFQQLLANSPQPCADRRRFLTLRWDLAWLQPLFPDWDIEPERMKEALRWLSNEGRNHGIEKVFLEPHIPARLGISNDTIRFQGCRAARHDDHIHIQLR
ncbi:hypothetical protein [Rhizobium sp. LjRoot254]|uniref:hypothetical protein n=1 Tax=Rhizobium sp. LjRoot254 TaxID=3342297 RepID=UPI003ECE2859